MSSSCWVVLIFPGFREVTARPCQVRRGAPISRMREKIDQSSDRAGAEFAMAIPMVVC